MKDLGFKSYKQVEAWLRKRTDKPFFITNTKGNVITIVICRDNNLLVHEDLRYYMKWLNEATLQSYLDFINQP